jgi:hypothetical protein
MYLLLKIVNKYNRLIIVIFVIFVSISIFWIYQKDVVNDDFEVYYSESGIPEVDE